jgi:alpha,alpha-trehalose phosphorylase
MKGIYFWDTEIYLLPFLTYTSPQIARNLLIFRYRMLPQARARAKELGHRGAMFPWRTINGEEASAYYAAGTAQYHINADIMYALRKYVHATGDERFLRDYGAEMLVETARLWLDLGFYSDTKGGRFCINSVTGPDEYNTVVNNNAYTNLIARENLRYASEAVEALRTNKPDAYDALVHRTALESSELEAWRHAAENMYVPYDEKLKIIPQDDSFLDREAWDFLLVREQERDIIIDDLHGTAERTREIESYPAASEVVGGRNRLTAQDRTGIPDRYHIIRPICRKFLYSLHHSFRSEGRP